MGLNPELWGRQGWHYIHIVALNYPEQPTEQDKKDFRNAKWCHICKKYFTEHDKKVRDHDHRTGCFTGAAHDKCNINYFTNRYLPVVFHNLRGYDSQLIIKKAP
jgi:hypothetical protein